MKNRLSDVHDHLMMRLEKLGDEELQGEALDAEIKRSAAAVSVAGAIAANARTVLDGMRLFADHGVPLDPRTVPMISHPRTDDT